MLLAIVIVALVVGLGISLWRTLRRDSDKMSPLVNLPGPKGLPVIGSIHELSAANPWMSFHKWSEDFGPIYQVNLAGHNHVWISDESIAVDLLSKRGNIYSDRPHIPALLNDNRTSGQYLPLMSRNELWLRQRKFAKLIMTASDKASFFGYPELEAVRLLKELLDSPGAYNTSLESFVSRVTCRLAWGTPVASDELKQRARELLIGVSPTGSLLNKVPFLMSLPDCLSPAKAWERRRTRTEKEFFMKMQDEVRTKPVSSPPSPETGRDEKTCCKDPAPTSWTQMFLNSARGPNGATYHGIPTDLEGAYAVGMHSIAGALTIAAPMQGFCLALCLYPQYLEPLYAELDRICPDAPPALSDMPDMPYLRACIRETLRWRPPVPTGIPHQLTQDDVYRGFHLPAKSIIHPLEWSMSRDARRYPRPNAFDPSRWLDPASPVYALPLTRFPTITGSSQFGFGRRVCQGQGVAEADLFVGLGALAWAFSISKARDPHTGLEIPVPEMDYSELLIAKPKWFRFDLRVRSEQRRAWIEQRFDELQAQGEFEPEKEYWDASDPTLGWGKV